MKRNQHRPSQSLIGKTVAGIISRDAPGGGETLLVLQFTDGSCFEFLSPAAQRSLRPGSRRPSNIAASGQLTFFPHDGPAGPTASANAC